MFAGLIELKLSCMSRENTTWPPAIVPMAATPTAIDKTTSKVRVLFSHRSLNTLRHTVLPIVAHDPAIGNLHRTMDPSCQVIVMCHHQDRPSLRHQIFEQGKNRICRCRIQVARRFIRNQNRRIIGQGSGNRSPLLLAARQSRWKLAGLIGQTHQLQQLHSPKRPFFRFQKTTKIHR